MRNAIVIAGLLASVVMTSPSQAQSNPPATKPVAAAPAANVAASNEWRTSKLIGVNVYNDQNEKIGDINDILLYKSGKVDGLILGVGGFLGMGEHLVKVSMDQVKFSDQPVKGAATTGSNTTSNSSMSSGKKWYPDHAVMNATKDQLKAMPQFKY
jgi:sporulation protein YlmC with PRC-barrel domain